ncbi:MAG: redoxin family protein [Planctomycetales bacterium]|nr:redoxin family protein [Planctomycetales bacterium]
MLVHRHLLFAVLATLWLAVPGLAGEIEIGAAAPDFSTVGVDDTTYNLERLEDARLVVLCFTCNGCPVARAYEERLMKFVDRYEDQGVKLIAINSNNRTEDLARMKTHAAEAGFNFPYVFDAAGDAARAYGAQVTPHFFVLDGDRKVAYRGAFDDDMKDPKTAHLAAAVDALLAGKTPAEASTKAFGCGLKLKDPG